MQSWTASPLKMGPISFPETSVIDYQSNLCKITENLIYTVSEAPDCNIGDDTR